MKKDAEPVTLKRLCLAAIGVVGFMVGVGLLVRGCQAALLAWLSR